MQNSILTFDYELFLGEDSGTCQKSIIEPCNKIIEILKKYNSKAIFFVDATYLIALQKYKHPDLQSINNQLKEIISIGSSVELHLHPQWLDAKPKKNRWIFKNFNRYRLHSLCEEDINQLFKDGINILEDITKQKVLAFRAGGWSITPFETLKKSFQDNDIKIDMSVLPGFSKNELPMHYYNFLEAPDKEYYKFEDDVCREDKNGSFLEIPVTTYSMFGFYLVINNIIKILNKDKIFGDGRGLVSANIGENIFIRIFKKNLRKMSVESQSQYFFKKSFKRGGNNKILSYVMHPKTMSHSSFNNLKFICKNTRTLNSINILSEYY
jgi:hypothetical protein